MKTAIKKLLDQWNLLEKIQFHPWYRHNRTKEVKDFFRVQKKFYRTLLSKNSKLIIDIGANVGDYSWIFSRMADKVIAVEPDSDNSRILRNRFSGNKKIVIVSKAVSASVGEEELFIESKGSGFNTLSNKWVNVLGNSELSRFENTYSFSRHSTVKTTTLDKLIEEYGKPDYIKIDVEGYEWEVIKGLHTSAPLISFESNLPEFKTETLAIIEYLDQLDHRYRFNYINESDFILSTWVSARDMISLISDTSLRYLDIFCTINEKA